MPVATAVVVASRETLSARTMTRRSWHNKVTNSELGHVRSVHATIVDLDSLSTISWQNPQGSSVSDTMALAADVLPSARVAILCVEEELIICGVAHNNRA